ncbi:hypothetical protein LWI28_016221 [Acer negundo]|uniref:Uncharacterized protein n=1 Tax=Acer negundo TaxID=4023 RepID=A0AAD5NK97_ACENE|nr:hypothetical protein LWI28_016221 [Acer negundo]
MEELEEVENIGSEEYASVRRKIEEPLEGYRLRQRKSRRRRPRRRRSQHKAAGRRLDQRPSRTNGARRHRLIVAPTNGRRSQHRAVKLHRMSPEPETFTNQRRTN